MCNVWLPLGREEIAVARCTVACLMREMGLQGTVRGKTPRTTISDKAAPCPRDKVNHEFRAPAPNRLRVEPLSPTGPRTVGEPFTHVVTWTGFMLDALDRLLRASHAEIVATTG